MPNNWLDDLVRADAGTPTLTRADLKGFPDPVLTHEQNQRFIIVTAEIGCLMRKLQSRKKADVAARDVILARLEDAKRRRDAIFL